PRPPRKIHRSPLATRWRLLLRERASGTLHRSRSETRHPTPPGGIPRRSGGAGSLWPTTSYAVLLCPSLTAPPPPGTPVLPDSYAPAPTCPRPARLRPAPALPSRSASPPRAGPQGCAVQSPLEQDPVSGGDVGEGC